ncbi:MAG: hypothetical protein VKO00_00920 [Cyanobacteriota bacterium]|nr:hypothetical protein [Cyanobacteriota bacterium]
MLDIQQLIHLACGPEALQRNNSGILLGHYAQLHIQIARHGPSMDDEPAGSSTPPSIPGILPLVARD